MPHARKSQVHLAGGVSEATRQTIIEVIAAGLAKGDSLNSIAKQIHAKAGIEPRISYAIAQYECSYATHAGQYEYGRSIGATGVEWLASSDACEICLSLSGPSKRKRYDEPFYVHGPGVYRPQVFHPPLHEGCACTACDWFEDP